MLIVPSRIEANMQGPGQPGMMPGSAGKLAKPSIAVRRLDTEGRMLMRSSRVAGYQAMLYQMQAGQFASTGQSNMAPRLALVQGG